MKISILMSVSSPWSRQVALKLSSQKNRLQVIDFYSEGSQQYLKKSDQAAEIDQFYKSVDRVDFIQSSIKSKLRYLVFPLKLKELLRAFSPDILLTLYGGGYGAMALLSFFRPYAVYIVGSDVMVMNPVKKIFTRIMLNKAEVVFVNGKYLAEKTREVAPKANIKPLYIGIDTKKFKRDKTTRSKKIRIVCTRGFAPVYNNQYIIEALGKLQENIPDFEFIFSSRGPLLENVKTFADKTLSPKIRKKVIFYGGVTSQKLVELLSTADIYISVSRSDGTSVSMLEAMSCSLYPVLSDIPQNREWLCDNNMTLVPLDQPGVFAQTLADTMKNISQKRKLGEKNRKLILELADEEKNIAGLISILGQLTP